MKVAPGAVALISAIPPFTSRVAAQTACVPGAFTIHIDGTCTPESLIEAYEAEVFGATGQADTPCGNDAASDLTAKLSVAGLTPESLCKKVYDDQVQVPFHKGFNRGTDLQFEQMFYNGQTDLQDEVETIYEDEDYGATSILKEDGEMIRAFHDGTAQGRRVGWPGALPNFQSGTFDSDGNPTCETSAMMCVWPKDRQANDGNGNCAANTYDENCVDKDPADNTNLCYVDTDRGNQSTGIEGDDMVVFPGDNGQGEGSIHCHGMAWGNDPTDHTARYKANNLFYVSAYDHLYVRGYVKNIPGAPMCGCVEQMPTVSRCDCTQVDLTEEIEIKFHADATVTTRFTEVHVDFNSCKGINNRNNDLYAYMGRLYYEGKITPKQWGQAGRIVTDNGCTSATKYELDKRGLTPGHDHDTELYTNVAGREGMKLHDGYGTRAFNLSLRPGDTPSAENPHYGIVYRICGECDPSHMKIFYRRRSPVPEGFSLINNILYGESKVENNVYLDDFTLHSTLEDALEDQNPWECPDKNDNGEEDSNDFDYADTFYGECSPDGTKVKNQKSRFQRSSDKNDVAYYVHKPEDEGLRMLPTSTIMGMDYAGGTVLKDTDTDTIYMLGRGRDIWSSVDDFNFYEEAASGDRTVIVHVGGLSGKKKDYWSKSGIMFRKSLDPKSAHYSLVLTGGNGVCVYNRPTDGASTKNRICVNKGAEEAWLKVEKRMDSYTAFVGAQAEENGPIMWLQIYTREVSAIGDSYHAGLAVTSHDWYPLEVVFSGFDSESYFFPSASPSASNPPSDYKPPLVRLGGDPDTSVNKLGNCEGDCDDDDDCEGELRCYQRGGTENIPGCSKESSGSFSGSDFCAYRSDETMAWPVGNGGLVLGLCEGDCDNNAECAEGLVCKQRSGVGEIPGCWGEGIKDWDYCAPACEGVDPEQCGCLETEQSEYRGFLNTTIDGEECQPWADQFPHEHSRTPENYPDAGLEANYCRNPDGEPGAWCYTKNPDKRWALCGVPVCGATARRLRAP